MPKQLLSGNEAIARGAWEAGVRYAAAYPGTPSTEIMPALAQFPGVKVEWASNEKVALDTAAGACFAGARALAAMKHVGVNVAADSLMTLSYTGVGAGFVLVSADDPGAFSSQNEQDNRHYARFGKFPCLEPADSQEAKEFTALAFELSERFDTPVMLRSTTRLSHSKGAVEVEMTERAEPQPLGKYERQPVKFVQIPAHARLRHPVVEERIRRLRSYAEECPLNRIEWGDRRVGIVTGGVAYQYAREVFDGCSFLKLGLTYPLPEQMIRDFAAAVERVVVVEELDPFIEEQIKALGIACIGKEIFPLEGELTLANVREGALKAGLPAGDRPAEGFNKSISLPPRIPAFCPGCPHRAVFFNVKKHKYTVAGDIGCYAISVLPPFVTMDCLISMGASIGMAHGIKQVGSPDRVIATIGDSTLFHAGLPALANTIYNNGAVTTLILDNGTTAMTGGQDNPSTGLTLQGEPSVPVDIERVVRAMGIGEDSLWVVNALDVKEVERAIEAAVAVTDRPTVVLVKGNCVFTRQFEKHAPVMVDAAVCNGCGFCLRVGCPAIVKSEELDAKTQRNKTRIDPLLCVGCTVCLQVCPRHAIVQQAPEGATA